MTSGHREGQALFEALGRRYGYEVRRSYSRNLPTDGVWYTSSQFGALPPVPVAAIEVIVSESRKSVRGSVVTLEIVSPALGVLLIHEEEMRRRLIRRGATSEDVISRVAATRAHACEFAANARQRIEVWSFADLVRLYREATGERSLYRLAAYHSSIAN
jgi:hypothetical protein